MPLLIGGPGLIQADAQGQAVIELRNSGPDYYEIPRGQVVGVLENAKRFSLEEIRSEVINDIIQKHASSRPPSLEDKKFIKENAQINVPEEYRQAYLNVLERHHEVFSRNKTDLGRSDLIQHEIHLKTDEPVYVKQFKMPDVHRDYLEEQVKEWLKLGIVQPTRSRYNSPMFLVNKKDGGFRVVQTSLPDFGKCYCILNLDRTPLSPYQVWGSSSGSRQPWDCLDVHQPFNDW